MFTRFGDVWKKVRLSVPGADPFLVRGWVADAYRELCDRRGWNWLTYQDQITWAASRDLTVTLTAGSTAVTSAGLFLQADAGRQIRVGGAGPIYTIQLVSTDLNTAELNLPYAGTLTGAQTITIYDAYATMPERFGRFVIVLDYTNQWFIPWWMTQDEAGLIDPARTFVATGPPTCLIARTPSTFPGTLGQIQYEFWGRPSAAGSFAYYAIARPAIPADDDRLPGVLGDRPDVLETGALSKAAKWPGTADHKNPYFNMALCTKLEGEFLAKMLQLDLRDDDQAQQSIQRIPWGRWAGWTWAYDTHRLQATDATLGDYWGYTGYDVGSYWP
jgi:hypothetical protein